MTSEPVTFLWVEIEGFRGFRDRQRIALDTSVVILAGANGTGKTSVFDALQWLLVGSLERLEPWRMRKNTELIANVFRGDEPAVVSAALQYRGGIVEIRRQGRSRAGVFEWSDNAGILRGEEAERHLAEALSPRAADSAGLRRLLMTSALLQQDVVREVLEDKPAERYQQLGSLLGLDEVSEFEAATRKRADRLEAAGKTARLELATLEERYRRARERAELLRTQQAAAPDTTKARAELTERLRVHTNVLRLTAELPVATTDALLLQSSVRELGDEFTRLASIAEELRVRLQASEPIDPDAASRARSEAEVAATAATAASAALTTAESAFAVASAQSEALASLANVALPLLGDHCPVCQQPIVKEDVAHHLRELIETGGADLPLLNERRNAARAASEQANSARNLAVTAVDALTNREAAANKLREEHERLAASVQQAASRGREIGVELLMAHELERLESDAMSATIEALRSLWTAAGDLANVLRALPTGEQIASAEGDVQRLEILLSEARPQAAGASARGEEARTLQRAATRAAKAVSESRFRLLAPLIRDIYSRLDPHPVFKTLDFALDIYREQGVASPVVHDEQLGIEADPNLVFSSSQANVAALSYFLALGWAAGADAMPFVLLDDPLQSLDDVNALGFADLCRHIRRQRQLIISTHDRRLAALLERKLAPRLDGESTSVVEFEAWTRRGPQLERRIVEPQLDEGNERTLVAVGAA